MYSCACMHACMHVDPRVQCQLSPPVVLPFNFWDCLSLNPRLTFRLVLDGTLQESIHLHSLSPSMTVCMPVLHMGTKGLNSSPQLAWQALCWLSHHPSLSGWLLCFLLLLLINRDFNSFFLHGKLKCSRWRWFPCRVSESYTKPLEIMWFISWSRDASPVATGGGGGFFTLSDHNCFTVLTYCDPGSLSMAPPYLRLISPSDVLANFSSPSN